MYEREGETERGIDRDRESFPLILYCFRQSSSEWVEISVHLTIFLSERETDRQSDRKVFPPVCVYVCVRACRVRARASECA